MPTLRSAFVHLAIGAVLSIAIAWSVVYFAEYRYGAGIDATLWDTSPVDKWPRDARILTRDDHVGLTVIRARWQRSTLTKSVRWEYTAQFAGLPFACVMSERTPMRHNPANYLRPTPIEQRTLELGIKVPYRTGSSPFGIDIRERFLPVRPLWPGLIADSVIFGACSFETCRRLHLVRTRLRLRSRWRAAPGNG